MNSIYCWFDWDDSTTTVKSINIIREPRKPWNEYFPGEEIVANLPKYGMWNGVIVDISELRADLLQKVHERQSIKMKMSEVAHVGVAKPKGTTRRRSTKNLQDPSTNKKPDNKTSATPLSTITNEDADKSINEYFGVLSMPLNVEQIKTPSPKRAPKHKHTNTKSDNHTTLKRAPSDKLTLEPTPNHTPSIMHTKTPRSSGVKRPLSRKYIDTDTSDSDADTLHVPDTTPPSVTYRNTTDTPHIANSSIKMPSPKRAPKHTNTNTTADYHTLNTTLKRTPSDKLTLQPTPNHTPLNKHTKTPRSSGVKRPLSRKYIDTDNNSDSDADTLHVPDTTPHSVTYRNIANSPDSDDSIHEHNLTPLLPLQHFPSHNQHMTIITQTASKCPRTLPTVPLCTQEVCVAIRQDNQLLKEQIGLLRAQNTRLQRECQDQRPASEFATANTRPLPGLFYDRQAPRENKMVELVRGSYVFLYETQLNLVTESAKSMSALARHLVDVFFAFEQQVKSNLSGENGLQRLNKTIIEAIISFAVSRDELKKQSPAEIKHSLRNKLGCLRAPSRKKKTSLE